MTDERLAMRSFLVRAFNQRHRVFTTLGAASKPSVCAPTRCPGASASAPYDTESKRLPGHVALLARHRSAGFARYQTNDQSKARLPGRSSLSGYACWRRPALSAAIMVVAVTAIAFVLDDYDLV